MLHLAVACSASAYSATVVVVVAAAAETEVAVTVAVVETKAYHHLPVYLRSKVIETDAVEQKTIQIQQMMVVIPIPSPFLPSSLLLYLSSYYSSC